MPAAQRGVFTYRVPQDLAPRIARGAFVRIPFRRRSIWGVCCAAPSITSGAIRGLRDILISEPSWSLTKDEVNTIEQLASLFRVSLATAAYLLIPSPPRIARAKKPHASYNEISSPSITPRMEKHSNILENVGMFSVREQTGVATQKEVIGDTVVVYQSHGQRIAAIRELARRCIAHGASALVITPHRVWLGPLSQALGGLPLVTVDTGARGIRASWDAVTAARKPGVVILGTRAAAWVAPPSLGAIIIDEAHSDDHKQWDMQPKYDARAITAVVATMRGIPRYLLSPAPRVEDWAGATHRISLSDEVHSFGRPSKTVYSPFTASSKSWVGSAQRIQLSDNLPDEGHGLGRPTQTVTPPSPSTGQLEVRIVRLDHFWRSGGRGLLTDDLLDAMRETIAAERTVLLLHNRRGRMGRLVCADCGTVMSCATCGQPIAEFAEGLRCRVCEEPAPPIVACPTCQSSLLRGRAIGTAGITEILQKIFPGVSIDRVDRDAPNDPSPDAKIIVATERYTTSIAPLKKHSNILENVGMFSVQDNAGGRRDVGLVGVLYAERYVHGDDYRTNERLLVALRDIAVWARTWHAHMIVQTADPAHPAIAALNGDLTPFMDAEQREREALHYPPTTRLIRFDTMDAAAVQNATTLKDLLKRTPHGTIVDVAGPFSYGFARGREVTSVLVHLRPDATDAAIALLVASVPVSWSVDVDPVALHA